MKLAKKTKHITDILSRFYHLDNDGRAKIVSKINDMLPDVFCKDVDGQLISAAIEYPPVHAIVHMSTVHYCICSDYSLILIKDRYDTATDRSSVLDVFPELDWKLDILKMDNALR